jgi:hypothetical protein
MGRELQSAAADDPAPYVKRRVSDYGRAYNDKPRSENLFICRDENRESAGRYLHQALEHKFEEQISRETFRNAVQEVTHWLSQGEV